MACLWTVVLIAGGLHSDDPRRWCFVSAISDGSDGIGSEVRILVIRAIFHEW